MEELKSGTALAAEFGLIYAAASEIMPIEQEIEQLDERVAPGIIWTD